MINYHKYTIKYCISTKKEKCLQGLALDGARNLVKIINNHIGMRAYLVIK